VGAVDDDWGMVLGTVSEFEFGFSSHLCHVASRCGSIGAESSLFCLFYFVVLRNCQRCCRTLRLTVQKHHSIRNKELFYSLLGILSLLTNILDVSGKENNNNKAFRPLLGACEGYYSLETS